MRIANQREQERDARKRGRAVEEVTALLQTCAFGPHAYLRHKGFPDESALVGGKGWLVIPVWNARNEIRSAQYIDNDGSKLFHPGGEIGGNFHRPRAAVAKCGCARASRPGSRSAPRFAAASSSPEVRVCFSAGNLRVVGDAAIRKGFDVFSVADNDHSGVGAKAAKALRRPCWLSPVEGQDANDYHLANGIDALGGCACRVPLSQESRMTDYPALIERKRARLRAERAGIVTTDADIHPALYDFQQAITMRALELGSCALFEDCGMARPSRKSNGRGTCTPKPESPFSSSPLSRSGIRWCVKASEFGVAVEHARHQSDVNGAPVAVTNYEMMRHFDPARFGGLVLDESSILKNMFGKMRGDIIRFAAPFRFRLAATATPAPNDLIEILNHAAYLGRMGVQESLSLWFTQADGNVEVQKWRLKGHAESDFWNWCGTWAHCGAQARGHRHPMPWFDLPELRVIDHELPAAIAPEGDLFPVAAGIQSLRANRRASIGSRVEACADLVNRRHRDMGCLVRLER